jgi:hypothetical protein
MPEQGRSGPRTGLEIDDAVRLLLSRPPTLGALRFGVVDGPSGSGKSTFAQQWVDALDGAVTVTGFSSDLLATWRDPFGWWRRFDEGVLRPLAAGTDGQIQLTDWSGDEPRPGDWLTIPPVDVLILEGVSCGRRALAGRAGVLVWVEEPDRAERLERAVGRDGPASRPLLAAWQHDEDAFFRADQTRERADLLVTATAP